MVSKKRHLAKAFTWRGVATLITVVTAFCVTGDWKTGLSVGVADTVVKFGAYYFHERLWYQSKWGVKEENKRV